MAPEEPFDLSNYLTDSLNLCASCAPAGRPMDPSTTKPHLGELEHQDPFDVLGIKVAFQPRNTSEDVKGTPIQEFYRGLNIFITGGTGFIGKTLIEKLIRSVPHLGHIYILIRPKRGKSPKERFDQLFEEHVFMRMKAEVPDYQELVTVVEGDIAESGLGLSNADHLLLTEKVHVVFHSAADVRFTEPLRAAIASNVYGSKRVMDLAREMKNLKSFVHVSTAFSQCVRTVIKEYVPKMSISYREVLQCTESMTDSEIQQDLLRLLQEWPNTYTFSKALSEEMVLEEAEDLPICIFRPAIVGPTYREPIKGWTDNLYGPIGLLMGGSMGIVHCFVVDTETTLDVVPVDYTANCMIAVAWQTASTYPRVGDAIHVYNFAVSAARPSSWKWVIDIGDRTKYVWPYSQTIWYHSFFATTSSLIADIVYPFVHTIPGKILDAVAGMAGQPQRLSKIYHRIDTLKSVLKYFATNNWIFENQNVYNLWTSLSPEDKELFNFDLREVDTQLHLLLGKLGLRYYYLKDEMDTIPSALRRVKWLKVAHFGLKTFSILVVLKLLVCTAHIIPI